MDPQLVDKALATLRGAPSPDNTRLAESQILRDLAREASVSTRLLALFYVMLGTCSVVRFFHVVESGLVPKEAFVLVAVIAVALISAINAIPALFVYLYANGLSKFVRDRRPDTLREAVRAERRFWVYISVLSVLMVAAIILLTLLLLATARHQRPY